MGSIYTFSISTSLTALFTACCGCVLLEIVLENKITFTVCFDSVIVAMLSGIVLDTFIWEVLDFCAGHRFILADVVVAVP